MRTRPKLSSLKDIRTPSAPISSICSFQMRERRRSPKSSRTFTMLPDPHAASSCAEQELRRRCLPTALGAFGSGTSTLACLASAEIDPENHEFALLLTEGCRRGGVRQVTGVCSGRVDRCAGARSASGGKKCPLKAIVGPGASAVTNKPDRSCS